MVKVKHLDSDEEYLESFYKKFLTLYESSGLFKGDVLKTMKLNIYSPENDYIEKRLKEDNISNKYYNETIDDNIIDVKAVPVEIKGKIRKNKSGTYTILRDKKSYGTFTYKKDAEFILTELENNDWDKNIIPELVKKNNIQQGKKGKPKKKQWAKPQIKKTNGGNYSVKYKNVHYGTFHSKSQANKLVAEINKHKNDLEYLKSLKGKIGNMITKRGENYELLRLTKYGKSDDLSDESLAMFNNSINTLNRIIKERNCSKSTRKGYESCFMMFCKFMGPRGCIGLDELVDVYFKQEDEGVPLRDRQIKKDLIEFRDFLVNDSQNATRTIRTYFSKIKTILRHLDVELPQLPQMKMERGYVSGYGDLPTHAMIRTACDQVDIELTSIILYMSSSGNAKAETLSLTVGMFLKGCEDYLDVPPNDDNIMEVIELLKDRHDIVPVIYLKRIKTDKWFYTCCSPEASYSIF